MVLIVCERSVDVRSVVISGHDRLESRQIERIRFLLVSFKPLITKYALDWLAWRMLCSRVLTKSSPLLVE